MVRIRTGASLLDFFHPVNHPNNNNTTHSSSFSCLNLTNKRCSLSQFIKSKAQSYKGSYGFQKVQSPAYTEFIDDVTDDVFRICHERELDMSICRYFVTDSLDFKLALKLVTSSCSKHRVTSGVQVLIRTNERKREIIVIIPSHPGSRICM